MIFRLPGLLVTIRKPELEDIPTIASWLATDRYVENFFASAIADEHRQLNQAEQMLQDNADDSARSKYFLVEERFERSPVALAMLCKIDWKNRHAEYAYLVGEERYRTSLIAGDMNVVLLDYFFHELNLNKVYGFVGVSNHASLRLNHFGGKHDGTLRMHCFRGAPAAVDVEVFSITRADYAGFVRQHAHTLLCKHLSRNLIRQVAS